MARNVLLDSGVPKQPSRVNRTAVSLAVTLVALVAGSPAARAGEAGEAGEEVDGAFAPEEPQTSWYGWQTLLADAGSIGLGALSWAVNDAKYGSSSYQSYELGSRVLLASSLMTYALG